MFDENAKNQNTLWWIASIAVSVVCCSALFVLFARYLESVKASIQDESMRLSILEQRQDRILTEIQGLREHGISPAVTPAAAAPTPAAVETAPAPTPDTAMAPSAVGSSAPVGSSVPAADVAKPAAPDIAVPTMPAMPATPAVPPATPAAPNKN